MPPSPLPNQASEDAKAGTERAPPVSAAMVFSATTATHGLPKAIPRITSETLATTHDALVSMLALMPEDLRTFLGWLDRRLRHEPEHLLVACRIARPDLRIEHARDWLAVQRRKDLLGGDASHVLARLMGDAGGVRRNHHVVELEQRVIERRRLL